MQLIIVESPTKAKTLSKFLGSKFDVDSTRGHIKDLPKSTLGVDIENNFKPDYIPVERQKQVIVDLKKKAKNAKLVIIATDPDREGEAIASHVAEILPESKTSRITFHEITKEAVEEAIGKSSIINQNLVNAQISRRVLDRLVGYKLSPLLWKKVRRGLSAGRVQSVAVRLIVEKENEIKAFISEEYWEIFVKFSTFVTQLINEKIINKVQADEIIENLNKSLFKISDVKKREVRKVAYPPFTTSTMTQAGARIFSWSARRTMSMAQRLYEKGLITYHRTDSLNLSPSAVEKARSFILKEYGEKYLPAKPILYKTKSKSAQEAHEAIRPTDISQIKNINELIKDEKKLYELIWKRYIACQMNPAVYSETTIDVEAKSKEKVYMLRASGQIMIFEGWRKLFTIDKEVIILPDAIVGEKLKEKKVWGDQKFTLAPARFNEASLIKTLEKLGIGRPSTYAPIISTIQLRSYVEKKEGKFFPTTIGFAVTEFLVKNFPIELGYGFTADMEESLDKIADGEIKWTEVMKKFWKPFEKKLVSVEKNAKRVKIETEKLGKKCSDCKDGELVIRVGRFGKFISCSNFPDCKHTEKYLEKIGIKCPDCKDGDVIIKKSKKGNFFGCSKYPDCKFASWKKPVNEKT